jgi:hypothetical protein
VFLTTIGPDGRTEPFELDGDDDWAGDDDDGVGPVTFLPPPPLPPPPPEEEEEDDDADANVRRCRLCDRMRSPHRLRRYPVSLVKGEFVVVGPVPPPSR